MPHTVPQEDYYCRFFSPMTGIIQFASFFLCKAQCLNSIITSIAVEIHVPVVLYDLDDCSIQNS